MFRGHVKSLNNIGMKRRSAKNAIRLGPSIPLEKRPITNRIKYATMFERMIARIKKRTEICLGILQGDPFTVIARIGSRSINGEAHLVIADGSYCVTKKIPVTVRGHADSIKEHDYYRKFGTYVKRNICPHFPLSYGYITCKDKCVYENSELRRTSPYCTVLFNELANGDLKSFILSDPGAFTLSRAISMFAQQYIGLYYIHKLGLAHNDMHWGNMLYHVTPKNDIGKYWEYRLADVVLYVRNEGQLWVLWDFERIKKVNMSMRKRQYKDASRCFGIQRWEPTIPKETMYFLRHCDEKLYGLYHTLIREPGILVKTALVEILSKYAGQDVVTTKRPPEHMIMKTVYKEPRVEKRNT
jgi:hypothetical protein